MHYSMLLSNLGRVKKLAKHVSETQERISNLLLSSTPPLVSVPFCSQIYLASCSNKTWLKIKKWDLFSLSTIRPPLQRITAYNWHPCVIIMHKLEYFINQHASFKWIFWTTVCIRNIACNTMKERTTGERRKGDTLDVFALTFVKRTPSKNEGCWSRDIREQIIPRLRLNWMNSLFWTNMNINFHSSRWNFALSEWRLIRTDNAEIFGLLKSAELEPVNIRLRRYGCNLWFTN